MDLGWFVSVGNSRNTFYSYNMISVHATYSLSILCYYEKPTKMVVWGRTRQVSLEGQVTHMSLSC